jgi:hypothetical protein
LLSFDLIANGRRTGIVVIPTVALAHFTTVLRQVAAALAASQNGS